MFNPVASLFLLLNSVAADYLSLSRTEEGTNDRMLIATCPYYQGKLLAHLIDDSSEIFDQSKIYSILQFSSVDGNEFLPVALNHLQSSNSNLRFAVLSYLRCKGNAACSSPVLMLLNDEENSFLAAKCLGDIGDEKTLVALDLWLKFAPKPNDDPNRKFSLVWTVNEARAKLKKRIETDNKSKK